MNQSPGQALRGLGDALSALAQALYEAENTPDLVFVKSQAEAGGPSAAAATLVVDHLARLWQEYPLATDVVDRLGTAVAAGDHAAVAHLLGPDAVTLPNGATMFVGALIDDLRARAAMVVDEAGALAGSARAALARLDAFATDLRDLVGRAEAVGGAHDVEITAAAAALRDATSAVAANPTDDGPLVALDRAVAAAGRRVETLERAHGDLPRLLAGARSDLDELRRLVGVGTDAAAVAKVKIANPSGLEEPLDAAHIDGAGPDALGPWLVRIEAQVQAGGWKAAVTELDRWRRTADRWLADARRVATANGAGVARRNELRGLLQAFRAKSLATGRAEDPTLVALHDAAEQALYLAPCDLHRAERLVGDYLAAVNAVVPGGQRGVR
ncbi:MAG: hypothetical protein QOE93_854 [Actinomycetota bacterium]|jgi:hypothetical protein|nr:hypothetical protein [Actinomycetota bacterium]